jgi:hypothetical protein
MSSTKVFNATSSNAAVSKPLPPKPVKQWTRINELKGSKWDVPKIDTYIEQAMSYLGNDKASRFGMAFSRAWRTARPL